MKKISLAMMGQLAIRLGHQKTIAKSLVIALLLAPSFAHAWPWSQDMANQISTKPQESVNAANPGMQPFPKRSVPVAGTTVRVADLAAAVKMPNPVPADEKSVAQGEHLFKIYCTPCHGTSGTGDGLAGAKLILKPWDLSPTGRLMDTKTYPDGHIWGYMTLGGAVMPPYANDLSVTERWHVVNYIRKVLQKMPAAQAVSQAK